MNSDSFVNFIAMFLFVKNLSLNFFINYAAVYFFSKELFNILNKVKPQINTTIIAALNDILFYVIMLLFVLFLIANNFIEIYNFYLANISKLDIKDTTLSVINYLSRFSMICISLIVLTSKICVFFYEKKSKSLSEHKTITKFEIKELDRKDCEIALRALAFFNAKYIYLFNNDKEIFILLSDKTYDQIKELKNIDRNEIHSFLVSKVYKDVTCNIKGEI